MKSLIFILKTYKNSRIMVKQRTREIELDFDRSAFQLLKTQVKAKKPYG
jgi:hypothetical protein